MDSTTHDTIEVLRHQLTTWYRSGHPWPGQPTLEDFGRQCKLGQACRELLDRLMVRLGSRCELQHLRLQHLLEAQEPST